MRLADDTGPGMPHVQVTYEFPTEYHVDLERWFDDSKLLVDLLSIAARLPLLTRTRYVHLAKLLSGIFDRRDPASTVLDVCAIGQQATPLSASS